MATGKSAELQIPLSISMAGIAAAWCYWQWRPSEPIRGFCTAPWLSGSPQAAAGL